MSEAFTEIKEYLSNPPVLMPPTPGHALMLYLTVHDDSLGTLLAQQLPGQKERAVYYLSKKFTSGETRHTPVERTCYALVWVGHRLRQYTMHYEVQLVLENDPLRYLFTRPTSIGRISKWQLQLTEFDISYRPQASVKGRSIADHITEYPGDDPSSLEVPLPDENIMAVVNDDDGPWVMYFDGAVNLSGSELGQS